MDKKDNIDDIVAFIFLKRLLTPINKTKPYKNGYVDDNGIAKKESSDMSLLDRLTFKIKRMLGSKISQLNDFLYIRSMGDSIYSSIGATNVDRLVVIKRLKDDIKKLEEKYGSDIDSLVKILIYDEFREK